MHLWFPDVYTANVCLFLGCQNNGQSPIFHPHRNNSLIVGFYLKTFAFYIGRHPFEKSSVRLSAPKERLNSTIPLFLLEPSNISAAVRLCMCNTVSQTL